VNLSEDTPTRVRPVLSNVVIGWMGAAVVLLPVTMAVVLVIVVGASDAHSRVEAINTAALTGLAVSGVAALLLAARRQRGLELERADRYQAGLDAKAEHQRRALAEEASRRDAQRRRDTELYAGAVAQLGSDRAAVRLGGLYALEQLGQDSIRQRQLVIDLICAYLRMPPDSATGDVATDSATHAATTDPQYADREREVRSTAQRILHRHLLARAPDHTSIHTGTGTGTGDTDTDTGGAGRFWPGMDLDLTGAWLEEFTLADCLVESARFDRAGFLGTAVLDRARFRGAATFNDAYFSADAAFTGAQFESQATFTGLRVEGDAWFSGAGFSGDARFTRARFGAVALFENVRFAAAAEFGDAEFVGAAGFGQAWFATSARFDGARFTDAAVFDHARFDGDVRFGHARFTGSTEFTGVRAENSASARPSSWPQGWTTRAAEEPGRLTVVHTAAPGAAAGPVPADPAPAAAVVPAQAVHTHATDTTHT
jgi:hypothetical protein